MSENRMDSPAAQEQRKEITVKFAKGLLGDPFTAKNGKECVRISIPNSDPDDKRPWAYIVTAANHVHENKFGKGMWMKLPFDGQMKVFRSEITGQTPEGKNVYTKTEKTMPTWEIKSMLESYKTRAAENEKPSLREALMQPGIPGNRQQKPNTMER